MIKHKIALALTFALLSTPFMVMSSAANAWHHGYRHGYGCCYHGQKNMGLVYQVVRQLRASPATYDQGIYVSARGHEVTLSGTVGTASQKATAINITRYTCGVHLVVDNLRLQAP